ncbi:unnamed protein product, partial [Rotaria magnacalcarata]
NPIVYVHVDDFAELKNHYPPKTKKQTINRCAKTTLNG